MVLTKRVVVRSDAPRSDFSVPLPALRLERRFNPKT
jgi:hypothetical protein